MRRTTRKPVPDGGEVFDSTIEVPVTIRNPDKPIGTHVFTAVARNDAGLRWTAVTIDDGDDAKGALDRITIPQEVLDRIAPTALPRSSIIVSDEPLSRDQLSHRVRHGAEQPAPGRLHHAQAYGRCPRCGHERDDGFGSFFQRGWGSQPDNSYQRNWDYQRRWGPPTGSPAWLGLASWQFGLARRSVSRVGSNKAGDQDPVPRAIASNIFWVLRSGAHRKRHSLLPRLRGRGGRGHEDSCVLTPSRRGAPTSPASGGGAAARSVCHPTIYAAPPVAISSPVSFTISVCATATRLPRRTTRPVARK